MSKKRVAIITRVSTKSNTDNDNQKTSLEYQKDTLINFVNSNEEWLFDESNLYSDRITGTTLNRNGFNILMEKLGIKIKDYNNKDSVEFSILANKNFNKEIDLIVVKSQSRFSRTCKALSLYEIFSKLGIDIYFYDLNTFLSEDKMLISILNAIDENYSKSISYNYRLNNIYKTDKREITYKQDRFPYDTEWIEHKKYWKPNKKELNLLNYIIELYLINGYGVDRISKQLKQEKRSDKNNNYLTPSHIIRLLQNRILIGELQYYQYPKDYKNMYGVDRDFLKNLNKQYLKCDYITPALDEKTFNDIQEAISKRRTTDKGIRNPFLTKSNKIKCGCCNGNYTAKNIYVNSNNEAIRSFKCSNATYKRLKKNTLTNESYQCNNLLITEPFIDEFITKRISEFTTKKNKYIKQKIDNLNYLKLHLLNLSSDNYMEKVFSLDTEIENLKEQLEYLITQNLASETAKEIINKKVQVLDNELKEKEKELLSLRDTENIIINNILFIENIIIELQNFYSSKKEYQNNQIEEFLINEVEEIKVNPKINLKKLVKGSKNNTNKVVMFISYKYENLVKEILEKIFLDKRFNILKEKGIVKLSKSSLYVKPISKEEQEPLIEKLQAILNP